MVPRTSVIGEKGFATEVAERIEAPQRCSTRAVYMSKWAIFVKWCDSHEVDFRLPSVSQLADFLLYHFKERNLQPSTIDGYRTAIADMVGNDRLNISKDENLTWLLDSFHRDKPKGRRGVPSWNLSLVLHQLTKAPFEPLRKASLRLWVQARDEARSMPGFSGISGIRRIGLRCLSILLLALFPRTSWQKRVLIR